MINPILALIIANIIWGAAPPIFKFALQNIPPFTLAFIRFFFAGLIFIPFMWRYQQQITKKDWLKIFLGAFFGITINISFFFLGLQKATSINAPIIASSGPVFLFIFAIIFLGEKFIKKVFFGMLISLIGVLIIILSPIFLDGENLVFGEIQGNFFFLVATLGAVFHTLFNKDVLKRVNSYWVTGIGFLFSALTFLPFIPQEFTNWNFYKLNVNGWSGIIFGVFFASALAYFLLNDALKKINAEEAGLFSYICPVTAVIIAIPLLNEYPNWYFFLGALFVFGGIFLAEGRINWHPFHKLKTQSSNVKTT